MYQITTFRAHIAIKTQQVTAALRFKLLETRNRQTPS